jgi:hypothetical protein
MLLLLTANVIEARCGSISATSGALQYGCKEGKHNIHALSWVMPFFEINPLPPATHNWQPFTPFQSTTARGHLDAVWPPRFSSGASCSFAG